MLLVSDRAVTDENSVEVNREWVPGQFNSDTRGCGSQGAAEKEIMEVS